MNGFNYLTSTQDNKLRGVVSARFMTSLLLNKNIEGVGTAGDRKMIELYFSDGSTVKIALNDVDADIIYYAPQ